MVFFIKSCWPIISQDFYRLAAQFHAELADLQCINSSYITLVPKKANPECVNDFRPISLMSICLKFLTKLMADRLQGVIKKVVHENQYGFIKGRTIQHCLAWSFEYIHQCQQSKQEILILKLDFEKAFDTIEHITILRIMEQMGFPTKWLNWVRMVFDSASSSILLNTVPGNFFKCRRGVRQGDPLSPLLFVLGAELLQAILNRAMIIGLLTKPIIDQGGGDFPVVQYADDTLVFLKASQRELFCLKALLNTFAQDTGLKINYHKSNIYPLNVPEENIENFSLLLGCKVGTMPFTYLGLPMGSTRPRVVDMAPLVDRVERRLTASASFLPYGGRLTLINSVLSAIPTYYMCSLKLPKTVIEAIDTARRNCLWRGSNTLVRRRPLAAWDKVCRPKDKGGLGVINLYIQNVALLLKHLLKFYTADYLPWVRLIWFSYYGTKVSHMVFNKGSFWWRDIIQLSDIYRAIAQCSIQSGSSVLFWDDLWNGDVRKLKFPELFSQTMVRWESVSSFANLVLEDSFNLPLNAESYIQFLQLQSELDSLTFASL